VTAWATTEQIPVDDVVADVGSTLNGHRPTFLGLPGDRSVTRIVVEHRDRFSRFGSECVQAELAAQGRDLVVVDTAEVADDLVGDVNEVLTSMCTRLYGNRAAADRDRRAVDATVADDESA
jgi:predicted site-specific integrase-resolvase